jgi:hypothetical protein
MTQILNMIMQLLFPPGGWKQKQHQPLHSFGGLSALPFHPGYQAVD